MSSSRRRSSAALPAIWERTCARAAASSANSGRVRRRGPSQSGDGVERNLAGMRLAERRKHRHTSASGYRRGLDDNADLPIPAGPTTLTTQPWPLTDRSKIARDSGQFPRASNQASASGCLIRPCCGRYRTAIAARRTGSSTPLMRTICGSAKHGDVLDEPRSGLAQHHRHRRGATDSIRCAMPTCSPIAV